MNMGRDLKKLKDRKTNSFTFEYPIHEPKALEIMEDFYKILAREGWDLREGMKHAIELYVKRHGPGNYTTVLDSFQPGGVKSEGQQEQEIVRHFQARDRDVFMREILVKLKDDLGYDPKRAAAHAEDILRQLRDLGIPVWR